MNNLSTQIEQRAVLVGVQMGEDITYSMDELSQLTEASGCEVIGELIQKKEKIDSAFYIGKGKLEELKDVCNDLESSIVVFNDELTGIQLRNIEQYLEIKVIDRTILILDIFSKRAVSKEGKLQVELAQLQYRIPRLVGLGKSLSRTGGGIGTRGPGEKKLETDRRHILRRMTDIKKELKEVKKIRATQRSKREKSEIPIVALVGYTNAGKSTIMNRFLQIAHKKEKSVYEEDMLFATLDTFQRKIKLETKEAFILIDTVGFVSKLPHMLIDAFKATLEEVLYADLLIHVVDASYEHFPFQMNVTDKVMKEIKAEDRRRITLFNKIDKINYDKGIIPSGEDILYISAKSGDGMDRLISKIREIIFYDRVDAVLMIPFKNGDIASNLCHNTMVDKMDYTEKGIYIETKLLKSDYNRYKQFIVEKRKENGKRI